MRTLALAAALIALAPSARPQTVEEVYETKKWAAAIARADALGPSPENDFWAARALRNLDRYEEARARYLSVLKQDPGHARAADAAIEAALMLVAPLEQVAHTEAERALAVRAAREVEEVAARHAGDTSALARASYIAGNVWRIAERDGEAEAAYVRARETGDASYVPKSLEKQAELAFRRLDNERAEALWRQVIKEHPRSSPARLAQRALGRLAVTGKPAREFEVELWAQGPPVPAEGFLGKVTLIYAFAVWCPHCKRELPHAANLLERHGSRGFQVIGLTANTKSQTTAQVFPFITDPSYRMSYPVAVDLETRTTEAWSLTGLPSAALVDRAGVVRWVGHPNDLTDEAIERLLAEKGAPREG